MYIIYPQIWRYVCCWVHWPNGYLSSTSTQEEYQPGCFSQLWRWEAKRIDMEHLILIPTLCQHKAVLCEQASVEIVITAKETDPVR